MGADKNANAPKKPHGVVANASSGSIDSQISESNDSNSENGVAAGDSTPRAWRASATRRRRSTRK